MVIKELEEPEFRPIGPTVRAMVEHIKSLMPQQDLFAAPLAEHWTGWEHDEQRQLTLL